MGVDLDTVIARGGRTLFELLEFCVVSVRLEPLFVFLVREYHAHPTAERALALYDVFCAEKALARVQAPWALPPRTLRVQTAVSALRRRYEQWQVSQETDPESRQPRPLPDRYLFDRIVDDLRKADPNRIRAACEQYDPSKSPLENLPGGRMTAGQRAFVDQVWLPRVRPQLVRAGFSRMATVG